MKTFKIQSNFDGLMLAVAVSAPNNGDCIGILQIAHGMAEHKERYYDFMEYLSQHGYVCIISDHRGHGDSVKDKDDYGYFYTEDENAIIEDLYQVTLYIKNEYPGVPVYLFAHSMGTLVARCYLQNNDMAISKLILSGPPTRNNLIGLIQVITQLSKIKYGPKDRNLLINNLVFKSFNNGATLENSWVSKNLDNVYRYNSDEKCHFVFTTNGFVNLFKLQKRAFTKNKWNILNENLDILILAGAEDPVVGSQAKLIDLVEFLNNVGYANVEYKQYANMSHEVLQELEKQSVYDDVIRFLNGTKISQSV